MSDKIKIAESVTKATTADLKEATYTALQPLDQALDVSAYQSLRLQLNVTSFSGANCNLYIITSMQKDSEDSTWDHNNAPETYFGQISGVGVKNAVITSSTTKPLLQYIRWKVVSASAATTTTISFTLVGLASRSD